MAQYIDKSALVAEIESKRKYAQTLGDNAINGSMQQFYDGMKQGWIDILSFIDTLEVEVDLEKEVDDWYNTKASKEFENVLYSDIENCDKHFFELGLSVNNPITASDRGIAEEIIVNLKRVEQDYRIDLTREMEWLRNKVKKGK